MFESLVNKKRLLKRDSNRTVIFTLTFSELLMDGGGGGSKKIPLPQTCHAYPTLMKKKIGKLYKSRDTPFEFC